MSLACICTGRRQRPARPTATPPTRIRTPTPMHTPTGTVRVRVMAMVHRRRRRRRRRLRRSQWPPPARWRRRRPRHCRRSRSRCCCPPLLVPVQRVPRSSAVSVVLCMFHVASCVSISCHLPIEFYSASTDRTLPSNTHSPSSLSLASNGRMTYIS